MLQKSWLSTSGILRIFNHIEFLRYSISTSDGGSTLTFASLKVLATENDICHISCVSYRHIVPAAHKLCALWVLLGCGISPAKSSDVCLYKYLSISLTGPPLRACLSRVQLIDSPAWQDPITPDRNSLRRCGRCFSMCKYKDRDFKVCGKHLFISRPYSQHSSPNSSHNSSDIDA